MKIRFILFLFILLLNINSSFALEKLWYLKNEKRSLESFDKNFRKIDIVGPQTYFLGMNGKVIGSVPVKVLNVKNNVKKDLKIMPLLANITFYKVAGVQKEYFDKKTINNLLEDSKNWEKVSKFMREEAYANNYYGWQLDLENIDVKYKNNLNDFVKYLKQEFDKDGLKLSIAVVSKISDDEKDYLIYEKKNPGYYKYWAGVYDYKTLGENTSFITVMAYDEPNSPGPVATLDWSKKVLEYSLKNISPDKISFGIPVYGWAYRSEELKNNKKHFSMTDYLFVDKKINNYNKKDVNNMTTGAGYSKIFGDISWVSYNSSGKNYTVWYEDVNSFKKKLEQIKTLAPNVFGISMWVLGDEDKRIWEIF